MLPSREICGDIAQNEFSHVSNVIVVRYSKSISRSIVADAAQAVHFKSNFKGEME